MTTKQKKELAAKTFNKMNSVEKMVNDELLEMGFSYTYTGTYYLRDAIIFAIKEKPGQSQTATDLAARVGEAVARKYKVKSRSEVFMSISAAIIDAFTRGNIDYLLDVFKKSYDYDKGKVSNVAFIITVAEKIKQEIAAEQKFNITQLRILIQGEVENITDHAILESLYGIIHAL